MNANPGRAVGTLRTWTLCASRHQHPRGPGGRIGLQALSDYRAGRMGQWRTRPPPRRLIVPIPPDFLRQATADYATLIRALRLGWADADARVPVIGFGGSYGGMLGSWMRRDAAQRATRPQLCTPCNGVACGIHTVCRNSTARRTRGSRMGEMRQGRLLRGFAPWEWPHIAQHCMRAGDTLRGRTSEGVVRFDAIHGCARWAIFGVTSHATRFGMSPVRLTQLALAGCATPTHSTGWSQRRLQS